MARDPLLRFRRSAAQLHALAAVERTIRATDGKCRRKYLRDFNDAFQTYRRVLKRSEVEDQLHHADIVLVGDYHALPASQRYTASLVERLASQGRQVLLGVEAVVARDQRIIDQWQRGEIDSEELRSRIRFETGWGYDWQPFRELLERARCSGSRIFGLDCLPRQDMRSIRARDRHAADKIRELRAANPDAVLVVLFGESHLAPTHMPMLVRDLRPCDSIITVLQNVDALYWLSAGEPQDLVEAVEVRNNVYCVFSAIPLEKYEHYRLCIERWRQERVGALDLGPSFYNLIGSLFSFINVSLYSRRGGQQHALIDELPEVWSASSGDQLERLLQRRANGNLRQVRSALKKQGSWFLEEHNAIVACEFRMPWAAEQAARFVHHACHRAQPPESQQDHFYFDVMRAAIAFLGSKILCPSRKLLTLAEVEAERHRTEADIGELGFTRRDYLELIDCLLLHKCHEQSGVIPAQRFSSPNKILEFDDARREHAVQVLGRLLGSEVYASYVRGQISKRFVRSLFFRDITSPGNARKTYFQVVIVCCRQRLDIA